MIQITLLVGLVDDGKVYIGADRSAVDAENLSTDALTQKKVFRVGEYVIAAAESFRQLQVLEHVFEPPAPPAGPLVPFLVREFVPRLRETLKEAGLPETDPEWPLSGGILLGVQGRLFQIQRDYAVLEQTRAYDAVGSGTGVALGALHTLTYAVSNLAPSYKVYTALEAAASHTFAVKEPFDLVILDG